ALQDTNNKAYKLSSTKGHKLADAAETKLKGVADNAGEEMAAAATRSKQAYAAAKWLVVLTLIIGVLAGIAVSWWIVSGIVRSIIRVTNRAKQIADNDLTGEPLAVTSRDELGELTTATNKMSTSLKNMVEEVTTSSNEVASAATEIAASSEEMASGMTEQTEQVTQISSAIEEMSASI